MSLSTIKLRNLLVGIILAAVLTAVAITFLALIKHSMDSDEVVSELQTVTDHQLVTITIGDTAPMQVEVVNTPASIEAGLSNRETIGLGSSALSPSASSEGMLFVLPQRQHSVFWMKEMKFDLDLVWIADNRVVGITANVPHPPAQTQLSQLKHYQSPQEVELVLELPAGTAANSGITEGDQLQLQ